VTGRLLGSCTSLTAVCPSRRGTDVGGKHRRIDRLAEFSGSRR
jgi:hypothetical protein